MNKATKVVLLAFILINLVQCVSMLRGMQSKNEKSHHKSISKLSHHQLILMQDSQDDYAKELAADPFPTPLSEDKENQIKTEIVQEIPQFLPDGPISDKEVNDLDEIKTTDDENSSANQPEIKIIDNTLNESESLLTGSHLVEDSINDQTGGNQIVESQAGQGDYQGAESAFGGDKSLTQDDIIKQSVNSQEDGKAAIEDPVDGLPEFEEETSLSGGALAEEAIADQLSFRDSPEISTTTANVGQGDYQSAQSAFGGDSTLSKSDISQQQIQSQEDGQHVENEPAPVPGINGAQVSKATLVDKQSYQNTQFVSAKGSANVGEGDYQSASFDFGGDPTLTQQDIKREAIYSYENGQLVHNQLQLEISPQEEQFDFLTGSSMTENIVTKLVQGQIDE